MWGKFENKKAFLLCFMAPSSVSTAHKGHPLPPQPFWLKRLHRILCLACPNCLHVQDLVSEIMSDDGKSTMSCRTSRGGSKRAKCEKGADAGRFNAENEMLEEITERLTGKLDWQILVLRQLKKGTFDKKEEKASGSEAMICSSTNKFNMMSISNWAAVLSQVDPVFFEKSSLEKAPKSWLCKTGCFAAMIDPTSAITSRKPSAIAAFMKARAEDMTAKRYLNVKMDFNEEEGKFDELEDYSENGCFQTLPHEDIAVVDKVKIAHVGSGVFVVVPKSMWADDTLKLHDNHQETLTHIKTAYDDVKVAKIFLKQGVRLPALHWTKKNPPTGDSPGPAPGAPAGTDGDDGGDSQASGSAARVLAASPPIGHGGARRPR